MRKLDPKTFRSIPWKNGGGVTTEALVVPAEASLDTFDLRISMARIHTDGPFSEFPGVDRTLVLTSGAGLRLETSDGADLSLDVDSPPFAFTGDDPIQARLNMGPVTDVNVMTRRGVLEHTASKVLLAEPLSLEALGVLAILIVLAGHVRAHSAAGDDTWMSGDVIVVTQEDGPLVAENSGGPATLLLVDVFRHPPPLESSR